MLRPYIAATLALTAALLTACAPQAKHQFPSCPRASHIARGDLIPPGPRPCRLDAKAPPTAAGTSSPLRKGAVDPVRRREALRKTRPVSKPQKPVAPLRKPAPRVHRR
ncbi:hypothetical protein ACIP5N_33945 [Streptomyces sp. NPDC088768]|uniref:hypothetical protein n=1 Tax=Streptomyces sp. NPDC088768 TaxID=3365894 RepID=UPI003814764A